ncbi:hypothetical protein DFH28DRAFT_1139509 [Melampsora americana]|nr:hypothetical protein DFH28DRAFT_1139509 [Melampsora americana]
MTILVEFPASTHNNSTTILSPLPPPSPNLQPPRSRSHFDFRLRKFFLVSLLGSFQSISSLPTSNRPPSTSPLNSNTSTSLNLIFRISIFESRLFNRSILVVLVSFSQSS